MLLTKDQINTFIMNEIDYMLLLPTKLISF
jgi:hypothetical protein